MCFTYVTSQYIQIKNDGKDIVIWESFKFLNLVITKKDIKWMSTYT